MTTSAGYWGEPTATADFCEPNYVHSHFVAELLNAVTSVPIVLCGIAGMLLCRRQRLGPEQTIAYGVIAVVGAGSVAFHATLLRTGQILDELPMLWAVLSLMLVVLETNDARRARLASSAHSSVHGRRRRAVLLTVACMAPALYFSYGFEVFIVTYGVSVFALVVVAAGMMATQREQNPQASLPRVLLAAASCTYAGGFLFLWLPGELLCHRVPLMQRLPMHALFHLTSAAGPHLGLTAFALARHEHERPTAPRSVHFCGLPAIDRGAALLVDKAV